jgi:hypothetical protein
MTEVQGIVKVEEERIKIENLNTKETTTLNRIQRTIQIQQSKNTETINEEEKENKEKENLRKEEYIKNVKIAEETCERCPLRCLVFIPICCGYSF